MIGKVRKYFSLFGMMAATSDSKIHSLYSSIDALFHISYTMTIKDTLIILLKPVQTDSTNQI